MSIWSALNSAYSYEDAFGAKDCTSAAMKGAISEWFRLYYEQEATEESDPCQRIAYTIVNKLTKTAFGEYKATGGGRFAQAALDALGAVGKNAMQQALIGGETWLKPVPGPGGFTFSVASRSDTLVFGRDGQGTPTDIGMVERTAEGRSFYTLLERRMLDARGRLTIRNMLYRAEMPDTLGMPVPLAALARYEKLPEEYTFPQSLGGLGLARMATPMENCVDGSKDGVSVYAPAVGLIRNIDHNEALLNGEFDRGQSRIIASTDLLSRGKNGRRQLADKLFVGFDDDPKELGLTITSATGGTIQAITAIVSAALLVLGVILLFTGAAAPLGLGLLAAGAVGLAATIAPNWDFVLDAVKKAWSDLKTWWGNNAARFLTLDYWANLGKGMIDGLLKGLKGAWDAVASWARGAADWLGGLFSGASSSAPSDNSRSSGNYNRVPRVAASAMPEISAYSIPALAQGAVIPPNREFMAVLGDQTSGNNLEAPEGLVRRIVREESGGNTALLEAILEAIKAGQVIMVDRKVLGRVARDEINRATRSGGKNVILT